MIEQHEMPGIREVTIVCTLVGKECVRPDQKCVECDVHKMHGEAGRLAKLRIRQAIGDR